MQRTSLAVALLICAGTQAAEPGAAPATRTSAPALRGAPAASAAPPATTPAAPPKRLDLRIGDIRNYMTPDEFRALITGREEDRNTILVQADAPLVPMKTELDVPGGIIAPFWALAHPTQAWRIFMPDPRVKIENLPPPQKVPPPFRAGVPNF